MHQWTYIGCLFTLLATVGAIAGQGSSVVSDVSKGKFVYQENCAACHGRSGKGDGYTKLVPPVSDLTSPAIQRKLDAELITSIHAGRPNSAMGSWRLALSKEEIHDVVAYLRTLKRME
jgi:mono/diheme cytochrome c family protein